MKFNEARSAQTIYESLMQKASLYYVENVISGPYKIRTSRDLSILICTSTLKLKILIN
jgi:hypothetical protein